MLRRFLGLSAVLSLTLVATAASASGPRSPYQRVEQIARFAPDQVRVKRAAPERVTSERTTPERPVVQKPGAERIRPSTDAPARVTTTTRRSVDAAGTVRDGNRKVWERVQRVARCEVDSCGKPMAPAQRDGSRLVSNQGSDPIQQAREANRNKVILAMIRAKILARKFPGN